MCEMVFFNQTDFLTRGRNKLEKSKQREVKKTKIRRSRDKNNSTLNDIHLIMFKFEGGQISIALT